MSHAHTSPDQEQAQQQRHLEAIMATIDALTRSVVAQFVCIDAPSRRKVIERVQNQLPMQLLLAAANAENALGEY